MDVCPTILYRMGLPVPDDMDGKVLLEAIEESVASACPPSYTPAPPAERERQEGVYSGEEAEQVVKALRDLGYLE
jgi:hypothetical protein